MKHQHFDNAQCQFHVGQTCQYSHWCSLSARMHLHVAVHEGEDQPRPLISSNLLLQPHLD